MVGIVANLVESTTVSYTFHNGAIEVICVQENAPARFLSDLCQTVFFIEPLEYFLAVRVHMRVYCQRHPTVRIPASIAGVGDQISLQAPRIHGVDRDLGIRQQIRCCPDPVGIRTIHVKIRRIDN